ncbi:MAG TPA: EAL domain-containing protein [Sphingomonas sp.]|nr:EAL domain-containing protein [Sphingomonas sp.]
MPFAVLLGLRDGDDPADAARFRGEQFDSVRRIGLWMVLANAVAVLLTDWIYVGVIGAPTLIAWSLTSAVVMIVVAVRGLRKHDHARSGASLRRVRGAMASALAMGAIWAIPPLAFCRDTTHHVGLWLILTVLMIATAIGLAPLALAAMIFIGSVCGAVAVRFALGGDIPPAAAVMVTGMLLSGVCLSRTVALATIRAARRALEERDETVSLLLRDFEDGGSDWLWETDANRRVVRANARFVRACGLDPGAIDGMPFVQVLAGPAWETGAFAPGLHKLAEKLKARESFRDLRLPVIVDGEERWWDIAASPRLDASGAFAGFRGVGSDVTEQRASADKINRMARYDTLTGLPNRMMLNETLVRAVAEAEKWGNRCAFMMLDLDRFKAVNDTLGHPIGDRLLQRVGERLGQLMGANEMCGRLGGDEFAVVVRDANDVESVERLARQIIDTLSRPYDIDQHTLHVGASIGMAVGPRDGRTAEMLIRSADLALYRSKDQGGGVFHAYEPRLHAQAEERRLLEMALRTALERGEMHLAYQPVVVAETGALTGFEALLRWTHPELGVISPVKFVALAEEARLIGPIGEWVLRTACEEAARWPSHVRVAVNVSAEQLHGASFVNTVTSALANSGLPADRLELEVTESVFMQGSGAVKVLERVLDLGVRLSLDDFGTGYSSLGYLSRTRFSSIKIDRSFVTAAATGVREAVAIIRAVVALARSLGMATTAEGVETETELAMVRDFGCSKVQGYYYGRPLPVGEARALACRGQSEAAAA